MEHVVEAYDTVGMQKRGDQFQIVGQAFARMVAVNMDKADRPFAELFPQVARGNFATVRLPRQVAIACNAVGGAVSKKTAFNACIGPIEAVDAHCLFTWSQAERHRNE